MRKKKRTVVENLATLLLIGILLAIFFPCPPWSHKGRIARSFACVNNLKQIGLILDMYEAENGRRFPPIDRTRDAFIFDVCTLYPGYMPDLSALACLSDPEYDPSMNSRFAIDTNHPDFRSGRVHLDCIADMSYCYLGWLVTSDEEAEAFFEAYDTLSPGDYDNDIAVAEGQGNGGGNVLYRLHPDAYRFLNDHSEEAEVFYDTYHTLRLEMERALDDPSKGEKAYFEPDGRYEQLLVKSSASPYKVPSTVPVVWEKPSRSGPAANHRSEDTNLPYGHVLYMDGHVEKVAFGEKFPMTETMARLLDERPRDRIPDCEERE